MKSHLLTFALFTLFLPVVQAQQQTKASQPCSDPKHHQFDFWLGEWNVTRTGKPNATPAKSKISRILDSCAILEEYTSADGKYSGKSLNIFDSEANQWRQFWVDNEGTYFYFTGQFQDDALHFIAKNAAANGKITITRMTFSPMPDHKVHQYIDQSQDDGKTWTLYFDGIYSRR
jgi:hypothetical protein